jgi:hypothetical protein
MPRGTELAARLATRQRGYRDLARQLAEIGLVYPGSVIRRYTRCGKPSCLCQADPPEPNGPYWQWSANINGRAVTRLHRTPGRALPRVDRQRPPATPAHH